MRNLLTLILLFACLTPAAAADNWGPWDVPKQPVVSQPAPLEPLQAAVRFFQTFISPIDGPRCPMYPTCSAYALQALDKHGPVLGSFITVDRLLHESGTAYHNHPQKIGQRIRFVDRLEENDFWLTCKTGSSQ